MCVTFLHCQFTFPIPLYILFFFLRWSHYMQPKLHVVRLSTKIIGNSSMRETCLFISSVIYWHQYGYFFSCVPSIYPHYFGFLWFSLKRFLSGTSTSAFLSGSSCKFPAPVLQSTISPRSLGSFNWRMVLETKIWALGAPCYWGVLVFRALSWQSKEIHSVCIITPVYPCIYNIYVTICVHIKLTLLHFNF